MSDIMIGKKPRRRFDYTEEDMANAFERLIRKGPGLPGLGRMWRIFREVDCHRGRPDFIALGQGERRFLKGKTIGLKFASSLVMSFLHEGASRTAEYLSEHSGMSPRSLRTALEELVEQRYAIRTANGSYVLNSARPLRSVEVWAFELKLDRPRRALFQAQQYRSFSQRVVIIVPPSQLKTYKKYWIALRRWGIGLATFDLETGDFSVKRLPRASGPRSRQHQAYALFQLLNTISKN